MMAWLALLLPLHPQRELAVRVRHELDAGRTRRPPDRVEPVFQLLSKALEKSIASVHTAPVTSDLEYYKSERFIHDDLASKVAQMVEVVRSEWREKRALESYAIAWPSETVRGDDGKSISGSVLLRIQDNSTPQQVSQALKNMVERTKAYGLVLIEKKGNELRVLFETHHGARAWVTPLERHGDLLVPGTTVVRDNAECLGLLWQARRGAS